MTNAKTLSLSLCLAAVLGTSASVHAGLTSPVSITPISVLYSAQPGESAMDAQGGSSFALAVKSALANGGNAKFLDVLQQITNGTRDFSDGRQLPRFEGDLAAAPFCPPQGNLRVHIIVNADYEKLSKLAGQDADVLQPAYLAACKGAEVTVHKDLSTQQLRSLLPTIAEDVKKGGHTIVHLSGNGIEYQGQPRFIGVEQEHKDMAMSFALSELISALRENCKGQCSVFFDACGEEMATYR